MPAGTWSTEQNPSAVAVAKGIMTGTTTRRVMGVAFLSPPRSPSTPPIGKRAGTGAATAGGRGRLPRLACEIRQSWTTTLGP